MAKSLLFLSVLSSVAYLACGHVALTFPPARKYDLDFLDNSRTPAPCGMPKGKDQLSILGNQEVLFVFDFDWISILFPVDQSIAQRKSLGNRYFALS